MEKVSYEEIMEDYFFSKYLRPATEWSYQKVLKSFIKFTGPDVSPADVDKKMVLIWRREVLTEMKLSRRTWNNKVAHMRAIFNHALKKGMLPAGDNPFNGVVTRPDIKRKKTLTTNQMSSIYLVMKSYEEAERLGTVQHPRRCALLPAWYWLTVLDTLKYTGMRQNQLLNLKLSDVNLEAGTITLRAETAKNHREHAVPIVQALYSGLQTLYDRSLEREAKPEDPLFHVARFSGRKEPLPGDMDPQPLRAFFRRLSRECRSEISPHRFRHTIATNMMNSPDRNLRTVQALLGHSTVNVTLEYVEGNLDAMRMAVEEVFAV